MRRFLPPMRHDIPYLLREHFGDCGAWYAVGLLCFAVGLGMGAFSDITIFVVAQPTVKTIMRGGFVACLIALIMEALILKAVVVFLNLHVCTFPLSMLTVILKGYMVGRNTLLIVRYFNFAGILFAALFYFPFQVALTMLLTAWVAAFARRCFHCFRHRLPPLTDLRPTLVASTFYLIVLLLLALAYSTVYTVLYSTIIVFRL